MTLQKAVIPAQAGIHFMYIRDEMASPPPIFTGITYDRIEHDGLQCPYPIQARQGRGAVRPCRFYPANESFSQMILFINDMDIIYLTSRGRTMKLCL